MVKSNRFRKRTSDRSGFDYLERELIRDKGSLVGSDERDNPPPSNISLGGEGDISTGEFFRSSTSTDIDPNYENPTFYITALDGISPSFTHPAKKEILQYLIDKNLSFSVPSLKAEIIDKELLSLIKKGNQKTLTLAPECNESLRIATP